MPEALFMVFLLDSKGAEGLAALLRSDGFFSGAVCLVRRTLARSAFHGFSIGFKRCKSVNLVDLVKSFPTSILYLLAKIGVDTAENGPVSQPRTGLSKFANT